MIQAGGDRLTEVAERKRRGQCRGAIDCLAFVVQVAHDDVHFRLNRAKLAHEGQRLEEKEGLDIEMAAGGHRNFEMKWAGPDDVVIDISHTGWETKTR